MLRLQEHEHVPENPGGEQAYCSLCAGLSTLHQAVAQRQPVWISTALKVHTSPALSVVQSKQAATACVPACRPAHRTAALEPTSEHHIIRVYHAEGQRSPGPGTLLRRASPPAVDGPAVSGVAYLRRAQPCDMMALSPRLSVLVCLLPHRAAQARAAPRRRLCIRRLAGGRPVPVPRLQRPVQLHRVRRAEPPVVVAQHAAELEAAALVERDRVRVAGLDVQLRGRDRGVRGGQPHGGAEQLGACRVAAARGEAARAWRCSGSAQPEAAARRALPGRLRPAWRQLVRRVVAAAHAERQHEQPGHRSSAGGCLGPATHQAVLHAQIHQRPRSPAQRATAVQRCMS